MGLMAAAGIGAAGAIGGSALSFMGGKSAAKQTRAAMERYLAEHRNQRETFLNQAESGEIRKKLQSYIGGEVGYSPDTVKSMRSGVTEDYGKSLTDMTRLTRRAGAGASGVMTPGRADRTSRLLGQNLASNRATSMRDIATKNADVALNNQRFAVSALPTYMPGTPSTTVAGPDVYQAAGADANIGSYMGPLVSGLGNMAGQYAIYSQLANPIAQRLMMWDPVMGSGPQPGVTPPTDYAAYYRHLSPTR